MRPRHFLLLLIALSFWACQRPAPEEDKAAPLPHRQDILNINKQPAGRSEFVVEWGKVKIPLLKYANPEVYGGMVEIGLEEFQQLVQEELRLLKKDKVLAAELVSIHRESQSQADPFWYAYPGFEKGRLAEDIVSTFRQGIRRGDVIALRFSSGRENIIVQSALIKIADPFEAYEPAVPVPRPRYDGDVYGFQVIQEPGRRPLLRIDTTAEATRHIYDMYRDNRQYRIIQIPGFQTRHRLLTERDRLFRNREIRQSVLLGCGHDCLSLSDFTDFGDAEVHLEWGGMKASPSSENYCLEDFRASIPAPLHLMVGERELPIRSFHLFTHGRERQPEHYVADGLQTPALLKVLYRLQPASTAYFDKIVVEDEQGRLLVFPQAFAFNIGAD